MGKSEVLGFVFGMVLFALDIWVLSAIVSAMILRVQPLDDEVGFLRILKMTLLFLAKLLLLAVGIFLALCNLGLSPIAVMVGALSTLAGFSWIVLSKKHLKVDVPGG